MYDYMPEITLIHQLDSMSATLQLEQRSVMNYSMSLKYKRLSKKVAQGTKFKMLILSVISNLDMAKIKKKIWGRCIINCWISILVWFHFS
jgi:hypothetical protein